MWNLIEMYRMGCVGDGGLVQVADFRSLFGADALACQEAGPSS